MTRLSSGKVFCWIRYVTRLPTEAGRKVKASKIRGKRKVDRAPLLLPEIHAVDIVEHLALLPLLFLLLPALNPLLGAGRLGYLGGSPHQSTFAFGTIAFVAWRCSPVEWATLARCGMWRSVLGPRHALDQAAGPQTPLRTLENETESQVEFR